MKSNTIVVTPLNVALGQPGSQLFQSPAQITPIPQGGSFNLEVPFPIK